MLCIGQLERFHHCGHVKSFLPGTQGNACRTPARTVAPSGGNTLLQVGQAYPGSLCSRRSLRWKLQTVPRGSRGSRPGKDDTRQVTGSLGFLFTPACKPFLPIALIQSSCRFHGSTRSRYSAVVRARSIIASDAPVPHVPGVVFAKSCEFTNGSAGYPALSSRQGTHPSGDGFRFFLVYVITQRQLRRLTTGMPRPLSSSGASSLPACGLPPPSPWPSNCVWLPGVPTI